MKMLKLETRSAALTATRLIAISALLFTTYVTVAYLRQPLIDVHAFRQTQTALTAYWIRQEGWTLAYQTPVAGFPWSIPFEFPIYQVLVASISAVLGLDLVSVGRFVSYLFLVACVWPAFALSRRLDLPKSVPWVFCALLWSSPLYAYWGRTFMIETAALFFSFASIPFAIDIIRGQAKWSGNVAFVLLASAAALQKSTTGGPVLLALLCAVVSISVYEQGLTRETLKRICWPFAILCIPLFVGFAWAKYADLIKQENLFGQQLTSSALSTWNFGTLTQKLAPETWKLIVWDRALNWNAAGILGAFLLVLLLVEARRHSRLATIAFASLAFFLLPIAIFTNVHTVHEYYQVGCVLYLIAALAIAIGGMLPGIAGPVSVPVLTLAIVLWNMHVFEGYYGLVAAQTVATADPWSRQAYTVGHYLRDHTRVGTSIVIFGQDYSSEIAFSAQRKSATLPPWFSEYKTLWAQPEKFLGNVPLGAIAVCPPTDKFPTKEDIENRANNESDWIHVRVEGCELLLSISAGSNA